MKINSLGLELIKKFEGCKLQVYADIAGHKTVGVGHMDDSMTVGDYITQKQSDDLLANDLKSFEQGVERCLTVPSAISSNQFSAMICLAFNIGMLNFEKSTLLELVNQRRYLSAANEFERWNKVSGKEVPGLTRRRQAEKSLFLKN